MAGSKKIYNRVYGIESDSIIYMYTYTVGKKDRITQADELRNVNKI